MVSLAAALSIPLLYDGAQPFPYRNLILFITFIVILVTLVFQGLTLPWVIRKIKLEDKFSPMSEQQQEIIIQKKIAKVSLQHLRDKYGEAATENKHLDNLIERFQLDVNLLQQHSNEPVGPNDNSLIGYQHIYLDLLQQQRNLLTEINHKSEFNEDVIRKYLALIDIEEFKVREKLLEEI